MKGFKIMYVGSMLSRLAGWRAGAAVIAGLCVLLVAEASLAGEPKLRTSPGSFDFGYAPEGYKVFHRYWLVNDGTDTLVIAKVKPQCGCTAVPLPADHITPGDSLPLDLSFNTKRMKGTVNKLVRIFSNDTSANPAKIYFTAKVGKASGGIVLSPPVGNLEQIDKLQEVIEITNTDDAGYQVSLASAPLFLTAALSGDSLAPGETLTLSLSPGEDVPIGPYETSVTLWFDGPSPGPATIPVKGVGYLR